MKRAFAIFLIVFSVACSGQQSVPIKQSPFAFSHRLNAATACRWSVSLTPNAGALSNQLTSVSAVSNADAWAAGLYSSGGVDHTLAEHWNGVSWSIAPTLNAAKGSSLFQGIYARTDVDVWAVGVTTASGVKTLVEHYDGTRWSIVPSPNVGTNPTFLYSVVAIAASDAWAIGVTQSTNGAYHPISEHWNGRAWSLVPVPAPNASTAFLVRLGASASNDVWATGYWTLNRARQTLIEHWNGSAWSIVPSPNFSNASNSLIAASADSTQDAWAVGVAQTAATFSPVALHWNGHAWTQSSPPFGSTVGVFHGIAAVSPVAAYAAGFSMGTVTHTNVEFWNGSSWSVMQTPNVGTGDNFLIAIAATPVTHLLWAVGEELQNGVKRTLALRC